MIKYLKKYNKKQPWIISHSLILYVNNNHDEIRLSHCTTLDEITTNLMAHVHTISFEKFRD